MFGSHVGRRVAALLVGVLLAVTMASASCGLRCALGERAGTATGHQHDDERADAGASRALAQADRLVEFKPAFGCHLTLAAAAVIATTSVLRVHAKRAAFVSDGTRFASLVHAPPKRPPKFA